MGLSSSKNLPIILLFGPSRAGKSSFINTLARRTLAPIGSASNESTTISVTPYNISVRTQNNNNNLLLIDIPGINDSKLRMSNAEINARVEEKILSLTTQDSLSCILVFESLASQPSHLRSTLCALEGLLGANYKQSVVVVLTKEDCIMDEEELEGAKKTAEGICKGFGMPYTYWTNNHHQFTVDEQVLSRQAGELKSKIESVSKYSMQGVKSYHQKIEQLARALSLTTPKNKRTEQFEVVSKVMKPYTVQVTKYRTNYRVYSKRRGGIAGAFGGRKEVVEPYQEAYVENETRYQEEEVRSIQTREVEIPFASDHFANIAKTEILKELRDKYRQI